ncbi:hypothetical protein [Klebsiella phage vB_KpnS-VAC2]|uniref:Uncharacterized protein n=1 Tax=Klebsiella phage vB_KpnS-VAC2 TaxID=2864369 RepID=A0AAE7XIW4_9CAUD|nr:hypothetical protein [Klebsiella phage vB_KpnS-VAC2]
MNQVAMPEKSYQKNIYRESNNNNMYVYHIFIYLLWDYIGHFLRGIQVRLIHPHIPTRRNCW